MDGQFPCGTPALVRKLGTVWYTFNPRTVDVGVIYLHALNHFNNISTFSTKIMQIFRTSSLLPRGNTKGVLYGRTDGQKLLMMNGMWRELIKMCVILTVFSSQMHTHSWWNSRRDVRFCTLLCVCLCVCVSVCVCVYVCLCVFVCGIVFIWILYHLSWKDILRQDWVLLLDTLKTSSN